MDLTGLTLHHIFSVLPTENISIWQIAHVCVMDVWYMCCGGAGVASGVRGQEEPHFLSTAGWPPTGCGSHCSHPSRLPVRPSSRHHGASPRTRCFTWPSPHCRQPGHQTVGVAARVMSRWLVFRRSRPDRSRVPPVCFQFGPDEEYCRLWSDWRIDWRWCERIVLIIRAWAWADAIN